MIVQPSVQSLFLGAMSHGLELGTGTGLVVQDDGRSYLITNGSTRRTTSNSAMARYRERI